MFHLLHFNLHFTLFLHFTEENSNDIFCTLALEEKVKKHDKRQMLHILENWPLRVILMDVSEVDFTAKMWFISDKKI